MEYYLPVFSLNSLHCVPSSREFQVNFETALVCRTGHGGQNPPIEVYDFKNEFQTDLDITIRA